VTSNACPYLTVPRLAAVPGLIHGFGRAGWSEPDFLAFAASLNARPVIMRQLHSDIVHRLDGAPAEKLEGDALMTNVMGLLLVIRTADCLPVFLVDGKNRALAAVHCGWRGTEMRILEKTVRAMGRAYGSKPGEMLAALGPSIGGTCYEVGLEVRDGFLGAGFPPGIFTKQIERGHIPGCVPLPAERSFLDLRAANVFLLEGLGFKRANILDEDPACTHCEPSLLSYRRDPRDPRRMYNFLGFLSTS
jgi:YfiH family protein